MYFTIGSRMALLSSLVSTVVWAGVAAVALLVALAQAPRVTNGGV